MGTGLRVHTSKRADVTLEGSAWWVSGVVRKHGRHRPAPGRAKRENGGDVQMHDDYVSSVNTCNGSNSESWWGPAGTRPLLLSQRR